MNALNVCFPLHLPPRGFWLWLVATQHSSSLASYRHSQGLQCPSPSCVHGGSDWQCQVSTGTFPSLSPSCHRARRLLKNLFHSSCHAGGNGRWWLWQHLSSWVWSGDCFVSASRRLAPGWSMGTRQPGHGGEGLGWFSPSSTHPIRGAHQLPSTSPQSQAGVFSCAPWRDGGAFCATIPPLGPCVVHNTLVRYLGVSLNPSISGHSSRHKVNLAVYHMWCSQNVAVPWHAEGELPLGHPRVTLPVSFPPVWQDPAGWKATPAAALPKPMAIKGPEMEELDGGPGCSSSPSRIVPSAHAGQACQDEGMGGWMGESGPGSPQQGQGAGAHGTPLCLPLLPGVAHLGYALRCWRYASPPTGIWGRDKAAFSLGT